MPGHIQLVQHGVVLHMRHCACKLAAVSRYEIGSSSDLPFHSKKAGMQSYGWFLWLQLPDSPLPEDGRMSGNLGLTVEYASVI